MFIGVNIDKICLHFVTTYSSGCSPNSAVVFVESLIELNEPQHASHELQSVAREQGGDMSILPEQSALQCARLSTYQPVCPAPVQCHTATYQPVLKMLGLAVCATIASYDAARVSTRGLLRSTLLAPYPWPAKLVCCSRCCCRAVPAQCHQLHG